MKNDTPDFLIKQAYIGLLATGASLALPWLARTALPWVGRKLFGTGMAAAGKGMASAAGQGLAAGVGQGAAKASLFSRIGGGLGTASNIALPAMMAYQMFGGGGADQQGMQQQQPMQQKPQEWVPGFTEPPRQSMANMSNPNAKWSTGTMRMSR